MIGDLPEIEDFFVDDHILKKYRDDVKSGSIFIQLSKGSNKWMDAEFLDVAVAGIGIHIGLNTNEELKASEMKDVKLRFIRKDGKIDIILKEVPVLVRWQERDRVSGNIKIGIHFDQEHLKDSSISNIIKEVKENKQRGH